MKFGVVGTSFIMDTILDNMYKNSNMRVHGIYSKSPSKAKILMDKFNIPNLYDNFGKMCSCNEINWIYICSPNSVHYEQAKDALLCGKNVLLEKPSVVNPEELEELKEIAVSKHLYLFEAIIPMFHPNYSIIKELLPQIGSIKLGIGTFLQYSSRYEALLNGDVPNVFNPEFAGGALMDLNLYNIYFFMGLFGMPDKVTYKPEIYSNGTDTNGIATLFYNNLRCECIAAKDANGDNSAQIIGDKGYIKVTPCASNVKRVELNIKGKDPVIYEVDKNPWSYEMSGIEDIVNRNDYDECLRRLDLAINVSKALKMARADASLPF